MKRKRKKNSWLKKIMYAPPTKTHCKKEKKFYDDVDDEEIAKTNEKKNNVKKT